eukprot:1138465-Pelagomonas_calceolata.AAC.1
MGPAILLLDMPVIVLRQYTPRAMLICFEVENLADTRHCACARYMNRSHRAIQAFRQGATWAFSVLYQGQGTSRNYDPRHFPFLEQRTAAPSQDVKVRSLKHTAALSQHGGVMQAHGYPITGWWGRGSACTRLQYLPSTPRSVCVRHIVSSDGSTEDGSAPACQATT